MSANRNLGNLVGPAATVLGMGMVVGIGMSANLDWFSGVRSEELARPPLAPGPSVPTNFAGIAKGAMPAVVNIATSRTLRRGQSSNGIPEAFDDPFFGRFFGDDFFRRFEVPKERRDSSLGSGVIVSADGYIITNHHVVADADEIRVLLKDRREFSGKIVGSDEKTDLAVIKVDQAGLPRLPWGDSDKLEVGEYALAIGNPFALSSTVTLGIISAVGRANVGIADYEDFVQTDAAINPGNSGGALVNARGELIGISTAILSRSGGYMGIGFAVPANMARSVMDSLIHGGKVVRGWLGVSIQEVTPDLAHQFGLAEAKGALVSDVMPHSPAAGAGLKSGDVILSLNGKPIESSGGLRNAVAATVIGSKAKLEVWRDKKRVQIEAKVSEQPKDARVAHADGRTGADEDTALAGVEVAPLARALAQELGLAAGEGGVLVTSIAPGSAAAFAGLQRGDVITEINGAALRDLSDFKRAIAKLTKSDTLLLRLQRRGGKVFIVIKP